MIKQCVKNFVFFISPLSRLCLSLFFDKKYMTGQFFERSIVGYLWAIKSIIHNNILRIGRPMPWPTIQSSCVSNPKNITFHPDDLNNFQSPGTYFQNFNGHIYLGKGSYIAPNVGIITANHNISNLDEHEDGKDIVIGEKCWIGMNAVILPGVILGARTIVAAGSIVNKSFPKGMCVIGGMPARVLKLI